MPPFNRHKNNKTLAITNISDNLWNIINSTLPIEKPNNPVGLPIIAYQKINYLSKDKRWVVE